MAKPTAQIGEAVTPKGVSLGNRLVPSSSLRLAATAKGRRGQSSHRHERYLDCHGDTMRNRAYASKAEDSGNYVAILNELMILKFTVGLLLIFTALQFNLIVERGDCR